MMLATRDKEILDVEAVQDADGDRGQQGQGTGLFLM